MKLPRWQQGIGAAALLAWTGSVNGQSVDTSMARAMVDQPLAMTVQVRGFDWPATRLTPDCVQVQIQQGESGDTIAPVRVRTIPSGDDGRVMVQISSPQAVTDTVLTGRLSLLCGADFTREFTVLVDPPVGGSTPRRADHRTEKNHPAQPTPLPHPAEPPAPTARNITRSDDPTVVPTAMGRTMDDAELQRLVNAVVTALAATSAATSPAPAPPAPPTENHASTLPWQDLREEQRQTRASLVALVARIERSERDVWRDAALVMAAVIGLSTSLLVLRLVREGLMPRMRATAAVNAHRLRRQQARSRTEADPFATPSPATTPSPAHSPVNLDPGFVDWSPPLTSHTPPPPASPASQDDSTRPMRWPDADFGHPTLDTTQASTQLLQELEPHVTDFPVGVAMVLEKRLQAEPGKCPWILLRLLTLYQSMAQPWNHERVAAQLEALYNVRIPGLDLDPAATTADLEAFPDTLSRIEQAWQHDDPAAELASLLLKPTTVEVLTPLAFEEALLLHSIVQHRQSGWLTAVTGSGGTDSPTPAQEESPDRWLDLLAA